MIGVHRSDHATSGVAGFEATDHARRLAGQIRYGIVHEADYQRAVIRVALQDGEIITDWIPWLTARAGGDRSWWAPEVGENVLLLSPSGELGNAAAMPATFSNANQPGGRPTVQRAVFADGTTVEYDRAAHHYLIDVAAGDPGQWESKDSDSIADPSGLDQEDPPPTHGVITLRVPSDGVVRIEGGIIHLNPGT